MDLMLGVIMGVSLAAACGFRVFVPFLVIGVAGLAGKLTLAPGFEWIATWPAILCFGTATALEITGYYVPWMDNLLDTIATPVAVVAGTVMAASFITGMDPLLQWTLAAVLGGGAAGTVQLATVAVRTASTITTGGLANPLISTVEWMGASTVSILMIVLPVLAALLAVGLVVLLVILARQRQRHRHRQLATV